jgi:protein-disulfide isomerase
MKRFAILLGIFLTACVPLEQYAEPTVPADNAEAIERQTGTGTDLLIVERLLPTGLIEIGDRDAELSLLLFTEHHCRYCKEFYREQFPLLLRDYINQGKLRLQIGILPLRKYIHSENGALGLLCAAAQGKGIPMHELLFELGAKDREVLMSEAATSDLDLEMFTTCLDNPETKSILEQQKSLARSLDIDLVPTFFLNGEKSVGLPHYADLRGMIDANKF